LAGEVGIALESGIYTFVITSLIINDFVSIIENLAEMDVPIPKALKDRLEQLKKQSDSS
jgi:phage-related holin